MVASDEISSFVFFSPPLFSVWKVAARGFPNETELRAGWSGRVRHFALAMVMLFLAIGFALGVPTSPATTAASAIRHLQPDGTESVSDQTVLPDATGNCPQGTCPQGTCPLGTCPHGPKPAGTSSHGPKPAGTKPGGTKPGGTHPYETRQNAIINSCVPDKSAPDCPMPPVCGDCAGEQELGCAPGAFWFNFPSCYNLGFRIFKILKRLKFAFEFSECFL